MLHLKGNQAAYLLQQMTSDSFSLENAFCLDPFTLRIRPVSVSVQIYDRFHKKKRGCVHTPPPGETLKPTDLSGNISTVSELLQN